MLGLLGVCIALFISRRLRPDFVALLAVAALPIAGILSFKETIAGFSDPIILMVALMFVISEGLSRTGVSFRVGAWILKKAGNSVPRVIVFLMLAVGILGSIMSTTAIIAIFLPIALNIASRLKISPSKILMPLAFAGIISGMMTLVATTPNMIMSGLLENETGRGFGFFSIAPIGIIVLIMAIGYMLYAHRFLGNENSSKSGAKTRRSLDDFIIDYRLKNKESIFRVKRTSLLVGKTLRDVNLRSVYNVNVICLERRNGIRRELIMPTPNTKIHANDILFADMTISRPRLARIREELGLEIRPFKGSYFMDNSMEVGMAEISIPAESVFIGQMLKDSKLREQYGLHIVGMRRNGHPMRGNILDMRLKVGDMLLVVGNWKSIRALHALNTDLLVLSIPAELDDATTAPEKAPQALFCMVLMVGLMVSGYVPNALAALIACLLMIILGCLDLEAAYKSIKWPTIILIMGMMPFAAALEKTGGVDIAAKGLFYVCGAGGPHVVLGGLFLLTVVTGLFMSNTITSILIGPIAITAAQMLHVSAYPFAMTVAVAASVAFMSPLSTSVNTLVWEPGRYTFWDFMRIGFPFSVMVMLVCIFLIPLLFPF